MKSIVNKIISKDDLIKWGSNLIINDDVIIIISREKDNHDTTDGTLIDGMLSAKVCDINKDIISVKTSKCIKYSFNKNNMMNSGCHKATPTQSCIVPPNEKIKLAVAINTMYRLQALSSINSLKEVLHKTSTFNSVLSIYENIDDDLSENMTGNITSLKASVDMLILDVNDITGID